jgi:hypothetical protein
MRPRSAPVWLALGLAHALHAQDPLSVGFADTVLFLATPYSGYGYAGPAPLFVQAWFPIDGPAPGPALTYHQLRQPALPPALQPVHRALVAHMDSAFVDYCLREPFDDVEPIDYAPFTIWQVKDSLLAGRTRSHRAPLPLDHAAPVVLYHHGAQGLSDENVWMAEHLAAHGFLFVSANFHWPMEGAMYGESLVDGPDTAGIRTMLRFTRRLANGANVFFVGHSWGAQEGWCQLHEPGLVDAFISLETTMEWKTDTAEVKEKWPEVFAAITTHAYPMPILMVADTDSLPPFAMFRGVRGDVRYLDPQEAFGHESYTSAYLLRLAGRGRFAVPDAALMEAQERTYRALLDEVLAFLRVQAGMPVRAPAHPHGDPFHRW